MLKKLFNRFGAYRKGLSLEQMWFLQEPAISPRNAELDPLAEDCFEQLRRNGFAVLPGNVSADICDEVVRDFRAYCEAAPESGKYKDANSLYERLASLHLVSAAARRIAFESRAARVVEAAFAKPFVVVGSLFFDKGSTQSIHRDTPAFFTNPLNHFFGVWTALEDVEPGSGPLLYYRSGHTVAPDDQLLADPSVNSENYFATVVAACQRSGLELVEYYPKKGDTLIWHPQLPHGGAPITKPDQSRRSIVFHYIPTGVPIYGPDTFFGASDKVRKTPNYRTIKFGNYEVIDQGKPRFFHNRYEGNFDEF
jgi:ectoine hydroxylase-related dioxygenase (phytanoyl-CoA dioxygenase family)